MAHCLRSPTPRGKVYLYIRVGANSQLFVNIGALVSAMKNFLESRDVVVWMLLVVRTRKFYKRDIHKKFRTEVAAEKEKAMIPAAANGKGHAHNVQRLGVQTKREAI